LSLENQGLTKETAPFSPQAFQWLGNGVRNTLAHPVTSVLATPKQTCRQSFAFRRERHRPNKCPAVYRFVCPDGRSYVGAAGNCRKRGRINRSNARLRAAFELHPPETWTFEVLERLPPGCFTEALREAEQHHIDRTRCR
jgi:hypothetical protein